MKNGRDFFKNSLKNMTKANDIGRKVLDAAKTIKDHPKTAELGTQLRTNAIKGNFTYIAQRV